MLIYVCETFKPAYKMNKRWRLITAFVFITLTYLVLFSSGAEDSAFAIVGGIVGCMSSTVVIIDSVRNKDPRMPFSLLFWRAICDFGLAVRFIAIPGFNVLICGHLFCSRSTADESKCGFPSAMFEFFAISSEAWFLCNGLDLYYSVTNPFSSLKTRMALYHAFTWSISLLFACAPLLSRHKDKIFGFWYVNPNIDDNAVCWIRTSQTSFSWPIWILFFFPLMIVYAICLLSLFIAYGRLRRGITRTFLPRMKLLITNTANLIVLILYWMILILFYVWAYFSEQYSYNHIIVDMLLYIMASKGFSALIVWILLSDNIKANEDRIEANKALREEVLNFATAGIRSSARAGHKYTPDKHEITRKAQKARDMDSTNTKKITPFFFLRFILGLRAELNAVETMVSNKRRSVNANFHRQTITLDNEEITNNNDVESRLSQRPTVLATTMSSNNAIEMASNPSTNANRTRQTTTTINDNETERFQSEGSNRASDLIENDLENDMKELHGNCFYRQLTKLKNYFLDHEQVEFTEYEPFHFRRIRLSVGITDDIYINYFSTTIKERLTQGGNSGAFFFFSKGEKFIAKSCTSEDCDSLRQTASVYADYLEKNKDSYISKIFGAYRLQIYGNSLYFFVMNNIFLNAEKLVMNEKYDIKGSWVARNAEPPINGQSVNCTHCEQKYIYQRKKRKTKKRLTNKDSVIPSADRGPLDLGDISTSANNINNPGSNNSDRPVLTSSGNSLRIFGTELYSTKSEDLSLNEDHCPYTVNGQHEPSVILKDNDLKYKIKLPINIALELAQQIKMDAEFLASIGVCDYSLLIGVHNTEYDVQMETKEVDDDKTTVSSSYPTLVRVKKDRDSAVSNVSDAIGGGGNNSINNHHNRPQSMTIRPFSGSITTSSNHNASANATTTNPMLNADDTKATTTDSAPNGETNSTSNNNTTSTQPITSILKPYHQQGKAILRSGNYSSYTYGGEERARSTTVESPINYSEIGLDIATSRKLEVMRVSGPDAYFVGIIDYQQQWTMKKKMERFFKIHFKGADPDGLSAMEPDSYKERFLRKIDDILDYDTFTRSITGSKSDKSS